MSLLIGVGGTGQHVALAVSRLAQIGALGDDIECRIVDADNSSELAQRTKTAAGYVNPKHGLYHPLGDQVDPFLTPFDPGASGDRGSEVTVRDLALRNSARDETRQVFDALFPPEQAQQGVDDGFYAQPVLGATAFAAQPDEESLIDELASQASSHNDVFICGSFIGGTGAGVIPSLVQRLASETDNQWYGMFHLKWLQPDGGGNADIGPGTMDRNMRHGSDYFYRHVRDNLRASVLLGPPPGGKDMIGPVTKLSEDENESYYHVLAAFAMNRLKYDAATNYDNDVAVLNHETEQPQWLLHKEWYDDRTLLDRLQSIAYAAELLDYYRDPKHQQLLVDSFEAFGDKKNLPAGLYESLETFDDDMGLTTWSSMGDFKPKLVDPLLERFKHRREIFEERLQYFRNVFGDFQRPTINDEESELRKRWNESNQVRLPSGQNVDRVNYLADRLIEHLLRRD